MSMPQLAPRPVETVEPDLRDVPQTGEPTVAHIIKTDPGENAAAKVLDNSKGLAARYTAVLTPSLVNVFSYGFTRLGHFELTRARRGPTLAAQLEALEKSDD